MLVRDAARRVDDEGLRQSPHPVVDRDTAARVAPVRIADAELVEEGRAFASSSWVLTPRKTTFWSLSSRHIASSIGASARHGGHHDAQKLRNTTLPRKSSTRTRRPPKSMSEKLGAGRPRRGEGMSFGSRLNPYARRARTASAGVSTATATIGRRLTT